MPQSPHLVIFDLDGTLTHRDTLLPYLFGFLLRHPWRILRTLHLPIVVAIFFLGFIDNARLKEYFLTAFLGGVPQEQINNWSSIFIKKLLAHGMRSEGLHTLKAHLDSGNQAILMSASPDFYVNQLGTELGFEQVVCTRAEWHNNRLTGRLASANHRGHEKTCQLGILRSSFPNAYITAYANSESDLELLCNVDKGVLVNATRRTRSKAPALNIDLQDWNH